MRLITARQCWHDCYFVGGDSPLARATEIAKIAKLGTHIQTTAYHDSNSRAMHVATAGKVQNAIATLPPELQNLGHWLYAPLTQDQQDDLAEQVQALIWVRSGLAAELSAKKREQAFWLVRAVMRDYQDLVLSRKQRLQTPQAIRGWLLDWHGVDIRTGKKNWWPRDVRPWHLQQWHILSDLDGAALAPVAAVVAEFDERQKEAA